MKTTNEQYNRFVSYCEKWIEIFGLTDWQVTYSLDETDDSYAEIHTVFDDRRVHITLSDDIPKEDIEKGYFDEEENALHESLHLAIVDLTGLAHKRFVTMSEITRADEKVVARLQRAIAKLIW